MPDDSRAPPAPAQTEQQTHSVFEDCYALAVGCILIAVGLAMLRAADLVTGGAAGVALLLTKFIALPPGVLFALVNLPFFVFAARAMGALFTLKTIAVSIGIAGLSILIDESMHIDSGSPFIVAIAGGTLLGMGVLSLARHGAGVGGVGVLTLWLQKTRGWNAGRTQIAIDLVILAAAAFALPLANVLWSLVSAAAMSAIVYLWHRPGRYSATSPNYARKSKAR
jgi:uncharacterized membrane-anchored protein YitT (DUF2179 family)